jgi:dihydropyrimidinase
VTLCEVARADVDIVVFDPTKSRIAVGEQLLSASKYTLNEGEELFGWADQVFVRGRLVAHDGNIVAAAPRGRCVPVVTPAVQQVQPQR